MSDKPDDTSVRVAVRIRPQNANEKINMCRICTSVTPGEPQVFLGKDKAFTYDYVFDIDSSQDQIYNSTARELIDGCFDGYNATIFAYGQTGSGKTYTMGTGFDVNILAEAVGIIPRAVEHLFNGINDRRREAQERGEPVPDFKVMAQFMELYNEEILDLLDTTRDPSEKGRKSHIKIHEDASGSIYTVGVTTRQVASLDDTMQCLKIGALSRTTASTNMNAQSSRSHAVFTLYIKQQRIVKEECDDEAKETDTTQSNPYEFETLTAKFHFVDLAGSERLKRTGATGDRAKEGISINCGLLALGNVISALGDKQKRGSHVPYRDSKLTRLLQDSLGGNSRTVMIACVSPSDRDFMETLNTLKYANRARNIKNKVVVNQDKTSKQIALLRQEIQELQVELMEYKQGKRQVDEFGVESINDMFHENTMLQTENNNLRQRIKALQGTIDSLTERNTQLLAQRDIANLGNLSGDSDNDEVAKVIQGYVKEIEELRTKLMESEAFSESLRRTAARTPSRMVTSPGLVPMPGSSFDFATSPDNTIGDILSKAKRDLKKMKKKTRHRKSSQGEKDASDKENLSEEEKQDHETAEHEETQEKDQGKENGQEDAGSDDEEQDENEEDEEHEHEDDNEVDDEMSSESDSNEDSEHIHENLATLTCEISIKEKLIEELETSQKRLHAMRVQYEEKLVSLTSKIKSTEQERDRVLANLGSIESQTEDKTRRVKEEFQKKLSDMQNEMKKLQAAKKEHAKLLRNQVQNEKQIKQMQRDLGEMKKTKVKLMRQMKEEAAKNRTLELRRSKEIAQLRKEQRIKDYQIRSLEADKRQKEVVLRRKQEEVENLRKRPKQMLSSKVAGRVGKYERPATAPAQMNVTVSPKKRRREFSARAAKQKWDMLEKTVSSIIMRKQTMSHMERDMDRWLKQREKLGKKLEKFILKKEKAAVELKDLETAKDLEEQIESLKANIDYVQDNIQECQSSIVQMEESKDDEPASLVQNCSLQEARYLLEHFVGMVISKGLLAAQKDAENKEIMAKLHQERKDSTFQRDILQFLIQDHVDIEIDDSLLKARDDSDTGSGCSSVATSPVDSMLVTNHLQPTNPLTAAMLQPVTGSGESLASSSSRIKDKARRKTATPAELLYVGAEQSDGAALLRPVQETPEEEPQKPVVNGGIPHSRSVPDTILMPPPPSAPLPPAGQTKTATPATTPTGRPGSATPATTPTGGRAGTSIPRPNSVPAGRPDAGPSPSLGGRKFGRTPDPSPVMRRKNPGGSCGSLSRQSSVNSLKMGSDTTDNTPPGSPQSNRRSRDDNVFSRLTSNTQPNSPQSNRGMISSVPLRTQKGAPLVHSHTAEGHTKAVLSVFATEELLFSSSKDRTAKVWDLNTGEEILSLDGHPNNVTCVRYNDYTHLIYTVSTYFAKVWDIRDPTKCVKTLSSSGITVDGSICNSTSRQVTCPPGETNINDVALSSTGGVLYSAAGNTVRIWDIRSFKAVGKLAGGHGSAVMVMAVDDTDTADGNICVVTGSKDHYIKVFEVGEDSVGVLVPKYNLEPPHYDGIQSLCLMGDLLFSGSRDTCIKKWDLSDQQLKQSINGAHKDWVCGLTFMPNGNCILSGCRGGWLKLWHVDTCNQVGEIKAHNSPINAITTNSNLIFSASNDHTVNIWFPMPENIPDFDFEEESFI